MMRQFNDIWHKMHGNDSLSRPRGAAGGLVAVTCPRLQLLPLCSPAAVANCAILPFLAAGNAEWEAWNHLPLSSGKEKWNSRLVLFESPSIIVTHFPRCLACIYSLKTFRSFHCLCVFLPHRCTAQMYPHLDQMCDCFFLLFLDVLGGLSCKNRPATDARGAGGGTRRLPGKKNMMRGSGGLQSQQAAASTHSGPNAAIRANALQRAGSARSFALAAAAAAGSWWRGKKQKQCL